MRYSWLKEHGSRIAAVALIVVATVIHVRSDLVLAASQVNVIVKTDMPCLFSIDGQHAYKGDPAVPIAVGMALGAHGVKAVSTDGQDLWESTFNADKEGATFTISLMAVRAERTRKESEAAALRLQLARVKKEVQKARERNATLTSEFGVTSSEDRDLIIRMITALEKKYAAESQLAENYRRSAMNLNSHPQSSQNTGAALAGLINTGFSLNATQNFTLHSERSNQILSCINSLTQELGGGIIAAFHKMMPEVCSFEEVHRFGLTHTTFSGGYHSGVLQISSNQIQWSEQKKVKDDFSITCAEVNGYGTVRGLLSVADELVNGNQLYIAMPKKHYAFLAGDRSGRENVLEALRTTCPRP